MNKEKPVTNKKRKRCSWCGKPKPVHKFNARKSARDGLQSHCKDCRKKKWADWYYNRGGKERQITRLYHQKPQVKKSVHSNTEVESAALSNVPDYGTEIVQRSLTALNDLADKHLRAYHILSEAAYSLQKLSKE